MKKIAADLIATEMYKLLKKAQDDTAGNLPADNTSCADDEADMADDEADMSDDADFAEDDLSDFLMKGEEESEGDDSSYVDDQIESMEHMAMDSLMREHESNQQADSEDEMVATASDMRLMSGLGRIEASLRNKGEGFAADLVRATASSIKQDIVKEAAQRNYVVKNLVKMASDLDRKGDRAAARMVKSTIMKINR